VLEEELVPRRGSGSGGGAEGGGGGGEGGAEEVELERGQAGEEAATRGGGAGHRHGRPMEAATRGGLALGMERENRRERFGEEEEEDDMWGPRVSDRGDEVYVFVYACSWAQAVSIRIQWHFCGKRRIIMACFKIGE